MERTYKEANARGRIARDIEDATGYGTLGHLFDIIVNEREDLADVPADEIVARVDDRADALWGLIVAPALDALTTAVLESLATGRFDKED